jgi:hypothetical protein
MPKPPSVRRPLLALSAVILLAIGCSTAPIFGPGQLFGPTLTPSVTPTSTPTPTPTATRTPTATVTPTTPPGGVVRGRVYLVDKDEAVRTDVELVLNEGNETVESTKTDSSGEYSFLIEEPGVYKLRVSVSDLLDRCDNLRSSSRNWPVVVRRFDQGGVSEVLAGSTETKVEVGDMITMDLELTCD